MAEILGSSGSVGKRLVESIDWVRVGEEIGTEAAPDFELQDVAVKVVEVVHAFLEKDLEDAEDVRVEERYTNLDRPAFGTRTGINDLLVPETGIVDLLIIKGGAVHLHDWKLVTGGKELQFDERDLWRPAWVMYSRFFGAKDFTYRRITLQDSKALQVELALDRYPEIQKWVDVEQAAAEEFLLRNELRAPWPRNIPEACYAFGSRCLHWDACRGSEFTVFPLRMRISPSFIETLKLCPERARHSIGDLLQVEKFPKATLGTAFHQGIAEAYRQAWHVTKAAGKEF